MVAATSRRIHMVAATSRRILAPLVQSRIDPRWCSEE